MATSAAHIFRFPNPVNEKVARTVAGLVVLLTAATLVFRTPWLLGLLAVGFWLRVLFGPRVSPFALLASRIIAPRLGSPKLVPGPPKRFAQGIGAALSTSAVVAYYLGAPTLSWVLVAMITVAAVLESVFAICLGCLIFGWLQRLGVIPASVCEACNDIGLRSVAQEASAAS